MQNKKTKIMINNKTNSFIQKITGAPQYLLIDPSYSAY